MPIRAREAVLRSYQRKMWLLSQTGIALNFKTELYDMHDCKKALRVIITEVHNTVLIEKLISSVELNSHGLFDPLGQHPALSTPATELGMTTCHSHVIAYEQPAHTTPTHFANKRLG